MHTHCLDAASAAGLTTGRPASPIAEVTAGAKAMTELVRKVVAAGLQHGGAGTKPHLERYCGHVQAKFFDGAEAAAAAAAAGDTPRPARLVSRRLRTEPPPGTAERRARSSRRPPRPRQLLQLLPSAVGAGRGVRQG